MLNRSCTCTYTAAYKVDVIQLACKRLLVLRQFPCIPLYAAATSTIWQDVLLSKCCAIY